MPSKTRVEPLAKTVEGHFDFTLTISQTIPLRQVVVGWTDQEVEALLDPTHDLHDEAVGEAEAAAEVIADASGEREVDSSVLRAERTPDHA